LPLPLAFLASVAMAPLQSSYGAIAEDEETSSRGRLFSKAVKAAAVVGLVIAGIGLVVLLRGPTTPPKSDYLATLDASHSCPHWPEFCTEIDQCIQKFHQGDPQALIPVDMCEDYVEDCRSYCVQCNCPPPAATYCSSFLAPCKTPEDFVFTSQPEPVRLCPYGFEQVGVRGGSIDGCGMDGCTGPANADVGWKLNEVACAYSCNREATCKAFTYHVDRKRDPVCKRYATDVVSMSVAGPDSEYADRTVCKVSLNPPSVLNPDCVFESVGTTLRNNNALFPYCPEDFHAFDFRTWKDVLCCRGTCETGKEGDAADDVVCKLDENSAQNYAVCTGFKKEQCLWAYGSAEALPLTTFHDYQIKAFFTYNGPSAAFLFRMQSNTLEASSRYMLKFDGSQHDNNVAFVFYDGTTNTETNLGPFSQLKFESGAITVAEIPEATFKSDIDAAITAATAAKTEGYCNIEDPDVAYYNNQDICFHGSPHNYGFKITAEFFLREATVMRLLINCDLDLGSMIYFDGESTPLRPFVAASSSFFSQDKTFGQGAHTIEFYGAEAGGGGGIGADIKFQTKRNATDAEFGPQFPLTRTNLIPLGPAPLRRIAPDALHEIVITVEGDTFGVELDGTMYATFTDSLKKSEFGGIGLSTWKTSMSVHHLQFLTLRGTPIQNTLSGYIQTEGAYEMYVDSVLAYQSDTAANKLVQFNAAAKIIAMKFDQIITVPKECKEGDVYMDAYPTGHPYFHHGGIWMPVCGHWFWENNNGCSAVCQRLGYSYDGAILARTYSSFSKDSIHLGMCRADEPIDQCTGGANTFETSSHCTQGERIGVTCSCNSVTGIYTPSTCIDKSFWVQPAFAFALSAGRSEPILVESVDHSSGSNGRHFNFNWKDLEKTMGHTLPTPQHLTIWNVRTKVEQAAVLWHVTDGGSTGDSHGRWEPYEASKEFDWEARDTFYTKATPRSMSSLTAIEDGWICTVTKALTDADGNDWYSTAYDRSSWQPAKIYEENGPVSSEVANVLNGVQPKWIGAADNKGACVDGNVKLSSYPTGIPYIYANERFSPICGHGFWNNRYGCDLVCQGLGYDSSDGDTPEHSGSFSGVPPEGDAIHVGICADGDTDLKACTGGYNRFPDTQNNCAVGQEVAAQCTCVGASGGMMQACDIGSHTLCVFERSGTGPARAPAPAVE